MAKKKLIALLGAALLAAPAGFSAATAQAPARPAAAPNPAAVAAALRGNHQYAACVVRGGRWALRVLSMIPNSTEEQRNAASGVMIAGRSCEGANQSAPMSRIELRGMIAEVLLERDFDVASGRRLRSPVDLFTMPSAAVLPTLSDDEKASLLLLAIGECAAAANRPGTAALLQTAPGTPEERNAFVAMVPAINGCVPVGSSFALRPRQMRGYVAEGAYRALASAASARN